MKWSSLPWRLSLVLMFSMLAGATAAGKWSPPGEWPMPERWLPLDRRGWTVVRPAADSRLIYVSSSVGNDARARVYAPGDPTVGRDPTRPVGPLRPFKTIGAAMEKARDGEPDWVLLKRGDTWRNAHIAVRSGRSKTEPSVVCAWGAAPARPVIRGRNGGVSFGSPNDGERHAVLRDLVLYCSFLDPNAPDYGVDTAEKVTRGMAKMRIRVNSGADRETRNVLVENCLIRFGGLYVRGWRTPMTNVVLRRNVVLDRYPPAGHTMGMWGAYASVLLEECIFDHNGWLHQRVPENKGKPGRANPLSHNTYCTGMYSTIFRNNVFLRAASIGNKFTANQGPGSVRNLVVRNNLYVDGEIGISMGGNRSGPLRWADCRVTDNVMLDLGRSRPTGRRLAWYIGATDWDGGRIARNLFLHQPRGEIRNVRGLMLRAGRESGSRQVHVRNVSVHHNLFHGLRNCGGAIIIGGHRRFRGVIIAENLLQFPGLTSRLVTADGSGGGVTFRGNTYWSGAEPDRWFRVGDESLSFDEWVRRSGERAARRRKVEFADPDRSIETYMNWLGGEPTIAAFIAVARRQSRRTWRPEFTAPAVNRWIRAGFGPNRAAARSETGAHSEAAGPVAGVWPSLRAISAPTLFQRPRP